MKLFIFAVGGTGARVLRSLTMLLASGVRIPNCDQVVPVLIDPDTQNGDVTRTVALLKRYARIHEALYGDGQKEKTGFFSQPMNTLAHLNTSGGGSEELRDSFVYDFGGISQPFRDYLKYNDLSVETQGLVDLLFTQDSLAANLDVGFRGSPNVGSVVLNAVVQSQGNALPRPEPAGRRPRLFHQLDFWRDGCGRLPAAGEKPARRQLPAGPPRNPPPPQSRRAGDAALLQAAGPFGR